MEDAIKEKILYRKQGIVGEHAVLLKSIARIVFGLMWAADGFFKLSPNFTITPFISHDLSGQNILFRTWYQFWYDIISPIPQFWVWVITLTEFGLAFSLIFGFMRKVGYLSGIITSLVIWGVPEHFGGPYDSFSTNIGTGIIYAMVFLLFIIINSLEGPSRYSIDYFIEQRFHWWRLLAEFS